MSEVMLQQTRVETVLPYYERFLALFPTPLALAEAPEDAVLAAWSGLGYYRRARMLQAGARKVADGEMPAARDALLALPGVGRYTAGAIASIAFGEGVGLVDGNVARVLSRIFAIEEDMKGRGMRRAEALAESLVPETSPGDWNQALMELGATVCIARNPACERCPVAAACVARATGRVAELPVIRAKAAPKPQRVQALVATHEGRVLLARRRAGGLYGGLWEPPTVDGGLPAKRELGRRFGIARLERRGRVTHVLSHRKLTVDVHGSCADVALASIDLPDAYERADWFDLARHANGAAERAIGLATLARKVLAVAAAPRILKGR